MASGRWITPRDRPPRWVWPPRSLTTCSSLPPEGAAPPAVWQSQSRGSCWREMYFRLPAIFSIVIFSHMALAADPNADKAPSTVAACKPVYLTLDTGHMAVAPLMADILNRHQVKVTFFAANERTQTGNGSLGSDWAPWWKARAGEGHEFASHTWDHVYWRADLPNGFRMQPSAGPSEGKSLQWTADQYCEELGKSARQLEAITGRKTLPLFRAPGGKTSPALLAAAKSCGYAHVGWSPAGFLGDELASDKYPNDFLLKKALRDIRSGDVLVAHLGIWSRKDPWAPEVLEPLITGLQSRGFCFKTLRDHPDYKTWIESRGSRPVGAPAK